jgi:hypothetical protein
MIQEHAIGIVSKNGGGQRCMKIGSMNLMVGSAKSLDIVSSVRPDLYHLACLIMAYQIRLGGTGFFRHAFANTEIVKRMHCIGRDNYTCADLSKLPTLLEHRDTITEMLESKRSAQTTDAAPDYRYTRDLHGDRLNAGSALDGKSSRAVLATSPSTSKIKSELANCTATANRPDAHDRCKS